ncbi:MULTISPECIES: HD domain-containing protein [Aliiglaciecola]|uniref:HD domain-containing protein n=1 Tax=Aliiglaciecola TaxID=1406885 RepID=UPI001C096134|nr:MULTISPECIES: HD domain-containing protein [Aliiglaciecola]MBU2878724.1 HD domain-containing protein [Aliiglaciecola lipolytica]MDO6711379.1 HD domain-containing protein [Aliiglaciecola sp. 2_MG-2023]MDO6752172.1 HD domain-containing protein [Aliiglaciecola sp. 1_MG-2023]
MGYDTSLKIALKNISNWIAAKSLYYSPERKKYLYGFYAGLGNFDVYELPSEYQCLISNSSLKGNELHAVVLSTLPIEHTTTDEMKPYETLIRCVFSAKLYGYQHSCSLHSAIKFASLHHANQKCKSTGEPYVNHLIEVVQLIQFYESNSNENMFIAAVLHNILEDTEVTSIGLKYLFGSEVSKIVLELTCNSAENSDDKKIELLNQISIGSNAAQSIKLAEVISNVSSIPSQWSLERKLAYIDWCKKVAKVCSSSSKRLYDQFNLKVQLLETAVNDE